MIIDPGSKFTEERLNMLFSLRELFADLSLDFQKAYEESGLGYNDDDVRERYLTQYFGDYVAEEVDYLDTEPLRIADEYVSKGWTLLFSEHVDIDHFRYLNKHNIKYVAIRSYEIYDSYHLLFKNKVDFQIFTCLFYMKRRAIDIDMNPVFEKAGWFKYDYQILEYNTRLDINFLMGKFRNLDHYLNSIVDNTYDVCVINGVDPAKNSATFDHNDIWFRHEDDMQKLNAAVVQHKLETD